jgi:hypothetical protein
LLNEADIALALGHTEQGAKLLAESRTQLEKAHPQGAQDAWRYAIWDSVDAQLLALQGQHAQAETTLSTALQVIAKRFGDSGFYVLLAKQRGLAAAPAR